MGGVVFLFPQVSLASTIYSQLDHSTLSSAITGNPYQTLGTGLTGSLSQMSFYFNVTAGSTHNISWQLLVCTGNHSGCSLPNSDTGGSVVTHHVDTTGLSGSYQVFENVVDNTSGFDSTYTLDPTKYYEIRWDENNGSAVGTVKIEGCAVSCFSAGSLNGVTNVADQFFILSGVQTVADLSYTSNLSPKIGSTTATTFVTLSFDYHAVASNNITTYAINLFDNNNASTSVVLTGSASSGDHSVVRTASLVSGHIYSYTAYVCSSNTTCYGGPQGYFSVVSGSPLTTTFYNPDTGLTATGSADFTGSSAVLSALGKVIPFSWFAAIYNAWNNTTIADSGNFSTLTIPFASVDPATSTPFGPLLPNWTALSSSTVMTYLSQSQLDVFKGIMSVVLYMGAALYIFRRTSSLIRT